MSRLLLTLVAIAGSMGPVAVLPVAAGEGGAIASRERAPARVSEADGDAEPAEAPGVMLREAGRRLLGAWVAPHSGPGQRIEFFHPNGAITTRLISPEGVERSTVELGRYTLDTTRDGLVLAIVLTPRATAQGKAAQPVVNEFLLSFAGDERMTLKPYAVTEEGRRVTAQQQPDLFPTEPLSFKRRVVEAAAPAVDVARQRHEEAVAALRQLGVLYGEKRSAALFLNADDDRLTRAAPFLSALRPLTRVTLDRCAVGDSSIALLSGLPNVEDLELRHTRVGDAGLKQLAAMPRLRRLDLTGTRVTDAGLEALKACRSLETLDVSLTAVTDLGLPHLARVKTLRRLSARGTRITHEGVEAQGEALEHVQAVFLGPAKGDAPSD
jgi:hypothetical protein